MAKETRTTKQKTYQIETVLMIVNVIRKIQTGHSDPFCFNSFVANLCSETGKNINLQ